MSDLIHQPTQTTKNGSFETKKKPGRPAKITEEVRDMDRESPPIDPKKIATAEDVAETVAPPAEINFGLGLVETYEQYYRALDTARTQGEEYIEVSQAMFTMITKGQKTPFLIHGNPAVYVYVVGTRDKIMKLQKRTADEVAGLKTS